MLPAGISLLYVPPNNLFKLAETPAAAAVAVNSCAIHYCGSNGAPTLLLLLLCASSSNATAAAAALLLLNMLLIQRWTPPMMMCCRQDPPLCWLLLYHQSHLHDNTHSAAQHSREKVNAVEILCGTELRLCVCFCAQSAAGLHCRQTPAAWHVRKRRKAQHNKSQQHGHHEPTPERLETLLMFYLTTSSHRCAWLGRHCCAQSAILHPLLITNLELAMCCSQDTLRLPR
jgi:hypothetical protein